MRFVPEAFKKLSAVAEAVVKSPVVAKRLVPVALVKVMFVEETVVPEAVVKARFVEETLWKVD